MSVMEGPLSKWTNVMQGWQYRWFVLDENVALLSYYTSKDKMKRGSRRGCVRLKGAIIGIDDDEESTFTITTHDQKTFHFQARDGEERQKWMECLEESIKRATHSRGGSPRQVPTSAELDRKLSETDAYLQMLIGQVKGLEKKIESCTDDEAVAKYNVIKVTADSMIESVKHAIVMMQLAKPQKEINGDDNFEDKLATAEDLPEKKSHRRHSLPLPKAANSNISPGEKPRKTPHEKTTPTKPIIQVASVDGASAPMDIQGGTSVTAGGHLPTLSNKSREVPVNSYSSSDDDDFFDATDDQASQSLNRSKSHQTESKEVEDDEVVLSPPVIASEFDIYDDLYDAPDDDELDSLDSHGSIIKHLISQVRIGMDLTKIVLPTFILERRSLLEMFADFFAHPDLFVRIGDYSTPEERMTEVVRWYMSAFHAGRKSSVAKKPYNPIIGETFRCVYDIPNISTNDAPLAEDGPVKWATKSHLCYIAEQVSHHPPISAFYAECQQKNISLDGYIWTKSKFLGLSIGVHMVGEAVISLLDHEEEYKITFPSGYGRSILTVPWIELGGKCTVSCEKTGYSGVIEFLTKPFYGGKKHQIKGQVFEQGVSKPTCVVNGEWNGVMWADYSSGRSEMFCDTTKMPVMKKRVQPMNEQDPFESRRLWKDVTLNLKNKDVHEATKYKQILEQRQREEAKERLETGAKIQYKHFEECGEHWLYTDPLINRTQKQHGSQATDGDADELSFKD